MQTVPPDRPAFACCRRHHSCCLLAAVCLLLLLLRRELGFDGVPYRETVMVLPTVNCLVELTQMPFTVVSLADIEIVNLERVGFNLKNFDMAIVFKVRGGRGGGGEVCVGGGREMCVCVCVRCKSLGVMWHARSVWL